MPDRTADASRNGALSHVVGGALVSLRASLAAAAPVAAVLLFVPLAAHGTWPERIAIASGFALLYGALGALLGALLALASLGRRDLGDRALRLLGALLGGTIVGAWVRAAATVPLGWGAGLVALALLWRLSGRRVRPWAGVSLVAVLLTLAVVAGALAPRGPDASDEEREALLTPRRDVPGGSWPEDAPRPRNVILMVIDTLRADHLGSYGYARDTSPHLDQLAREGIRFEAMIVQRPKTSPSVASLLTGLYPHTHGITRVRSRLPQELDTLAERFRRAGYETAGFVSNINLFRRFGFDQGFDTYEEYGFGDDYRGFDHAELVNEGVVSWLDAREAAARDRPFFLYVHYMDPHGPYAPPAHFDQDRFVGDALYGRHAHLDVPVGTKTRGNIPEYIAFENGSRDIDLYVARYDAEIAYCDREIGRLLERMRSTGLLDESLLVVTADHGESLTEHGIYFEHGSMPYENTIRVPMIVRHPALPAGHVVEDVVQSIDIPPTLLDAAGVPRGDAMEGGTLVPLLLGEGDEREGFAYAEAGEASSARMATAVRGPRFKLVHHARRGPGWYAEGASAFRLVREVAFHPGRWFDLRRALAGAPGGHARWELFDIREDPHETHNLVMSAPRSFARLQERWAPFREAAEEPRPELRIESDEVDDETLELLRSLGYVK